MKKFVKTTLVLTVFLFLTFAFGGCDAEETKTPEETQTLEETRKSEERQTSEAHTHSYVDSIVAPTCTEQGYTLHQCDCSDSYQSDFTEPVGHRLNDTEYTWNNNYTECTASRSCSVCDYGESETVNTTYVKEEATQEFHAVYIFTAVFENQNFPEKQYINRIAHDFKWQFVDSEFFCAKANCLSPETYYKSCFCGAKGTDTFTVGETIPHKIIDGQCVYCKREDILCEHYTLEEILLGTVDGLSSPALCSCEECNNVFYKNLTYSDIDMPILYLDAKAWEAQCVNGVKNTVEGVGVKYTSEKINFEDTCSVKVQGSSSVNYPKKNYNIKFSSKVKLVDSWGKQKKYCLKANYVDFSQARNIVSCKIYGQIVHSRNFDDEVNELVNGGAVDGYPVLVYIDNAYHGLYTLNIPKDNWLMDMKTSDKKEQAMLSTGSHSDSVKFLKNLDWENEGDNWEFEFYSNEESKKDDDFMWAVDSMNELITFVNTATDEEFKRDLRNYIKVERSLDTLLLINFVCAQDNLAKNTLWITYDGGDTWQPSIYDMDGTWGMVWDGTISATSIADDCFASGAISYLWTRMYQCFYDEFVARYKELRKTVLSYENIESVILDFQDGIFEPIWDLERTKWSSVPSNQVDQYEQMLDWARQRLAYFDYVYGIE